MPKLFFIKFFCNKNCNGASKKDGTNLKDRTRNRIEDVRDGGPGGGAPGGGCKGAKPP